MDPYASYGLLPRPPATVFSDPGTEATRFRFPDFTHESDPAEALRQWIRPLFFWSAPDYYIVQVKVTSTLLIVIILLGGKFFC